MERDIIELRAIKIKTIHGSIVIGVILEDNIFGDEKVSLLYMNYKLYNLVNGKVRSRIDNDVIGIVI